MTRLKPLHTDLTSHVLKGLHWGRKTALYLTNAGWDRSWQWKYYETEFEKTHYAHPDEDIVS